MDKPPPSGAKVRVTQITDIDENIVITDPTHEYTMDWQDPPTSLIGQVGTVIESSINDYYDCTVRFDWNAPGEDCAMKYADLELVEGQE